jgi:predicted ATPase
MPPSPNPARHILTGPPGAGKTVLARGLEHAGFAIVEEAATDVISWAQAKGEDAPWNDARFCDRVLVLQLKRARTAPAGAVVFDRSPVCTLALAHFLGRAPSPALNAAATAARDTYGPRVFFIESLDFIVNTAARRISLDDARRFGALHRQVYADLGFNLVDIPPGSPAERLDLVLSHLR